MATERAVLSLDTTGGLMGLQLSIQFIDEEGAGHGYRLFGPKYAGNGAHLRTYTLTELDCSEIRGVLDAAFPPPVDHAAENARLRTLIQRMADRLGAALQAAEDTEAAAIRGLEISREAREGTRG